MIIRKTFKAECGHIVKEAYTTRCKKSLHGHSYIYELFLNSAYKDNAGMVTDFTFVKKYFNSLFDSFDHASVLWTPNCDDIIPFFKEHFERVVVASWNSTAETQSMFFLYICSKIIEYLNLNNLWENGEQYVQVDSVIVHETTTGYAKADYNLDLLAETQFFTPDLFKQTEFSDGIMSDWTPEFKQFWEWLQKTE